MHYAFMLDLMAQSRLLYASIVCIPICVPRTASLHVYVCMCICVHMCMLELCDTSLSLRIKIYFRH